MDECIGVTVAHAVGLLEKSHLLHVSLALDLLQFLHPEVDGLAVLLFDRREVGRGSGDFFSHDHTLASELQDGDEDRDDQDDQRGGNVLDRILLARVRDCGPEEIDGKSEGRQLAEDRDPDPDQESQRAKKLDKGKEANLRIAQTDVMQHVDRSCILRQLAERGERRHEAQQGSKNDECNGHESLAR